MGLRHASRAWKHTHNDLHHTWTNVLGKDKDVGYSTLRMADDSRGSRSTSLNPVYQPVLAPFFEWGIAIYDLELEAWQEGEKSEPRTSSRPQGGRPKARRQFVKDYVAVPAARRPFGSGKQALSAP